MALTNEDYKPTVANSKVSIIVPMFNCAELIQETLDSIQKQTHLNWEAILVDDASTDNTALIAKQYARSDDRFKVLINSENLGAAKSRNKALEQTTSRYIAYLDSDDVWLPEKLELQLLFMIRNELGVTFTSYETINEDGSHRNFIHVEEEINYHRFLTRPPTCSHTILFDTDLVDKELLLMPDLKRRQDAATWLQVIKSGHNLRGLDLILAKNRKRRTSLSANKRKAVAGTWYLYRNIEQLSLLYAVYCITNQMFNAAIKRMGHHNEK